MKARWSGHILAGTGTFKWCEAGNRFLFIKTSLLFLEKLVEFFACFRVERPSYSALISTSPPHLQANGCLPGGRGGSQRASCVGEEGGGTPGPLHHVRGGETPSSVQSPREHSAGWGGHAAQGPGWPSVAAFRSGQGFFPASPLNRCRFTWQALLREKQKTEELEKTKEAFKLFIQEAAVRTRKEVKICTMHVWIFQGIAKKSAYELRSKSAHSLKAADLVTDWNANAACFPLKTPKDQTMKPPTFFSFN